MLTYIELDFEQNQIVDIELLEHCTMKGKSDLYT